ncbi:hypothetical protein D3C80_1585330 [compost metagenome]
MPERGMTEIMGDGCTFHHFRINDKPGVVRLSGFHLGIRTQQAFGCLAGNLRHLERVGQTGPVIIAGAGAEYL